MPQEPGGLYLGRQPLQGRSCVLPIPQAEGSTQRSREDALPSGCPLHSGPAAKCTGRGDNCRTPLQNLRIMNELFKHLVGISKVEY